MKNCFEIAKRPSLHAAHPHIGKRKSEICLINWQLTKIQINVFEKKRLSNIKAKHNLNPSIRDGVLHSGMLFYLHLILE